MQFNIHDYTPELMNLSDEEYDHYLDELSGELSEGEPFRWMIKGSIRNAVKPFGLNPHRDRLFQELIDHDLNRVVRDSLQNLTTLLPPPMNKFEVHILPAVDAKGGGASYAPGKILLCIQIDEFSPIRARRNTAHEYSHAIRMVQKPQDTKHGYGEAVPYSLRDYLVFEGLASVLPEVLYPHDAFQPVEITEARERDFWKSIDPEAIGMDAYIKYMTRVAYEIGAIIVRSYLKNENKTIIGAHSIDDEELYWKSGYPYIR